MARRRSAVSSVAREIAVRGAPGDRFLKHKRCGRPASRASHMPNAPREKRRERRRSPIHRGKISQQGRQAMSYSNAPLGLVPSWLRPGQAPRPRSEQTRREQASSERPAPPPAEALVPEPAPAPVAEAVPPAPTAAERRAEQARWDRRWRACADAACRRERRCRFTLYRCHRESEARGDPNAIPWLYQTIKWKLGEGPKPPDLPRPPDPPPPRRRRRGKRRRERSSPLPLRERVG